MYSYPIPTQSVGLTTNQSTLDSYSTQTQSDPINSSIQPAQPKKRGRSRKNPLASQLNNNTQNA